MVIIDCRPCSFGRFKQPAAQLRHIGAVQQRRGGHSKELRCPVNRSLPVRFTGQTLSLQDPCVTDLAERRLFRRIVFQKRVVSLFSKQHQHQILSLHGQPHGFGFVNPLPQSLNAQVAPGCLISSLEVVGPVIVRQEVCRVMPHLTQE